MSVVVMVIIIIAFSIPISIFLYSTYELYIINLTYKERSYIIAYRDAKHYNCNNISYHEHCKRRMRFQGRNGRWKDWYLDIDKLLGLK